MIRHNRTTIALVVIVMLATVTATAPVTAQEEDGDDVLDGLLDTAESSWSSIGAFVSGIQNRVGHLVNSPDDVTGEDIEADVRSYYNSHSGEFEGYVNQRVSATTSFDTLKITYDYEDESATHYLIADVNGSDYENSSIVTTLPDNRSVDEECTIEGAAAANAEDELREFRGDFIADNETVTTDYLIQKRVEYGGVAGRGGQVTCSFMEDK